MRRTHSLNRLTLLAVTGALMAAGCRHADPPPNIDLQTESLEFADYDIEDDNGGLDDLDEEAGFGNDAFEDGEFAEDEAPADDLAEFRPAPDPNVEPNPDPHVQPTPPVYLRVLWGNLDGRPFPWVDAEPAPDADADRADGQRDAQPRDANADEAEIARRAIDWAGGLFGRGVAIRLERTIRFEDRDRIVPRDARNRLQWMSHTGPHFDGVLVSLHPQPLPRLQADDAEREVDANGDVRPDILPRRHLTFRTSPLTETFAWRELQNLDLVIPVDRRGNAVSFVTVQPRPEPECQRGFLSGRWRPLSAGHGVFGGKMESANGRLSGHLRGHYGVRNGRRVFFGKIIDRDGRFDGFVRGTWNPVDGEPGGRFHGAWVTANGRHRGVLGGHYRGVPGVRGGVFHGRFKEACDAPPMCIDVDAVDAEPVDPQPEPAPNDGGDRQADAERANFAGAAGGGDRGAERRAFDPRADGHDEPQRPDDRDPNERPDERPDEEPNDCGCERVLAPVCGANGVVYNNACLARCAQVEVVDDERCHQGCPDVYAPVCGADGVTYSNACEARRANVEVTHEGECRDDCVCPDVWAPVCGVDGATYGNRCEARCERVEVAYEGECDDRCECPEIYAPVCGADGNTYDNRCFAGCADVRINHEGECRPDGPCPDVVRPVCGADGVTYDNDCLARLAGVHVDYNGACADECVCPAVWAPVCGVDGETYGNACEARCAGAEIRHQGECRDECACPDVWDPVCGVDGQTYGNACEARCAQVEVRHEGECRDECGIACAPGYQLDEERCECVCAIACAPGYELAEDACECVPTEYDVCFDEVHRRILGGLAGADLRFDVNAHGIAHYSQSYAWSECPDVRRARLTPEEMERLDWVLDGYFRLEDEYNCNEILGAEILDAPDAIFGVRHEDRGQRVRVVAAVCWDELPDVLAELSSAIDAIIARHFSDDPRPLPADEERIDVE